MAAVRRVPAATETDEIKVKLGDQFAAVSAIGAGQIEVIEPGSTTNHPPASLLVIPALRPLPDIADHVDCAVVWAAIGERARRLRALVSYPAPLAIRLRGVAPTRNELDPITKGHVTRAPARGFPFVLRTEALTSFGA